MTFIDEFDQEKYLARREKYFAKIDAEKLNEVESAIKSDLHALYILEQAVRAARICCGGGEFIEGLLQHAVSELAGKEPLKKELELIRRARLAAKK